MARGGKHAIDTKRCKLSVSVRGLVSGAASVGGGGGGGGGEGGGGGK